MFLQYSFRRPLCPFHFRFLGIDPEPRVGLRGGHIPKSKNVPFNAVRYEIVIRNDEKPCLICFACGILQEIYLQNFPSLYLIEAINYF